MAGSEAGGSGLGPARRNVRSESLIDLIRKMTGRSLETSFKEKDRTFPDAPLRILTGRSPFTHDRIAEGISSPTLDPMLPRAAQPWRALAGPPARPQPAAASAPAPRDRVARIGTPRSPAGRGSSPLDSRWWGKPRVQA